jgi:hypothetical protein
MMLPKEAGERYGYNVLEPLFCDRASQPPEAINKGDACAALINTGNRSSS